MDSAAFPNSDHEDDLPPQSVDPVDRLLDFLRKFQDKIIDAADHDCLDPNCAENALATLETVRLEIIAGRQEPPSEKS